MDQREARARRRRRERTVELVKEWAIPTTGLAAFLLGQIAGEPGFWKNAGGGFLAAGGMTTLLHPGAFFGWQAPRWWFSESRPSPSRSYLRWDRISGAIGVVVSVPLVLLVPGSALGG